MVFSMSQSRFLYFRPIGVTNSYWSPSTRTLRAAAHPRLCFAASTKSSAICKPVVPACSLVPNRCWKRSFSHFTYYPSQQFGFSHFTYYRSQQFDISHWHRSFNHQASRFLSGHSSVRPFTDSAKNIKAMDLTEFVALLNSFAPTNLAASWDNVGLLVEPSPPHVVAKVLLTNDLTEDVLQEAIDKKAEFILSYHPPIFEPLKRLTMKEPKERIVIRALENRIAIYSPHTCYDVVEGGVNDWLLAGLGGLQMSRPLEQICEDQTPSGDGFNISFNTSNCNAFSNMQKLSGVKNVTSFNVTSGGTQVTCTCQKSCLGDVVTSIQQMQGVEQQSLQITQLCKPPMARSGMGRFAVLSRPAPTSEVVTRIKSHLKLDNVQVAIGQGKTLNSMVAMVAVCAGSGSSILKNVKADLYLTGEMSHHSILAAVATGTTVVICNHSNTERGYLHIVQEKLTKIFENKVRRVTAFVSETDRDPLQVI